MHKVVVGIPTLNNPTMLESCLHSIYGTHDMYKKINIKVLILDDGSNEENLNLNKTICAKFGLDLLMHGKNYGVATAWNNLSNHTESDIVILLNDDVRVAHNWIDTIIYTLDNNPEIGVVGLNAYESGNSELPANNVPTYVESRIMLGGNLHPILSAKGYAFAFRKSDFKKIGGFDNNYFCFFEEVDFNLRITKLLNKRSCILSHPIVFHKGGATTFENLKNHKEVFDKSKDFFEKKWGFTWEDIRVVFNNNSIPHINTVLNEWNSNFNVWG
jgi:GT2 family glycosyltransferase